MGIKIGDEIIWDDKIGTVIRIDDFKIGDDFTARFDVGNIIFHIDSNHNESFKYKIFYRKQNLKYLLDKI